MKKYLLIGAALTVMLGVLVLLQRPHAVQAGSTTPCPCYFAQVDKNNIVLRVIVATPAFIASGAEGDPTTWKQTSIDSTVSEGYAGKGHLYKKDLATGKDEFVSPSTSASATFDILTNSWKEPAAVITTPATTTP